MWLCLWSPSPSSPGMSYEEALSIIFAIGKDTKINWPDSLLELWSDYTSSVHPPQHPSPHVHYHIYGVSLWLFPSSGEFA